MGTFQQIQRKNDHSSPTYIQAHLEVGKEDDEHEKEANHVADKVMRMPEKEEEEGKMPESKSLLQKMPESPSLMKMRESPAAPKMPESGVKIQKQTNGSSAGIAAPQNVEQGINSSKGNGSSLSPNLQQELGSKMNADFSDVKVHTDSTAVQMNKDISAKAFTHGNDIYFNSGQYNPASSQGKHLLAHELTHTVQQSGNVQRKIQRQTANTDFGQFETTKFTKIDTGGKGGDAGVAINLKFHPDENKIDAKSIALSQSVKTTSSDGKNYGIDPTTNNRIVQNGKAGAGYYIDQLSDVNNPIYSQNANLGAGKKLSDTPKFAGAGSLGVDTNYIIGKCYKILPTDARKVKEDAQLSDGPHGAKEKGERKTFETAAFATEGVDKGKYYGSVKWGYQVGGTTAVPVVTITDITTASKGIPTQNYIEAAILWNAGKTRGTLKVIADPATVAKGDLTGWTTTAKNTKLRQISTVAINGSPSILAEILNAAGVGTGKNVYIKNKDVKDMGDGAATKKIPLDVTTAPMTLLRGVPLANIILAKGTVVQLLDPVQIYFGPTNVRMKVISGPYAGIQGYVSKTDALHLNKGDAWNVKNEGDI